jgi:hypothetical protein
MCTANDCSAQSPPLERHQHQRETPIHPNEYMQVWICLPMS